MKRSILILTIMALSALWGCGSGSSTSEKPVTYHSVLKQADITTKMKHIIFFNSSSHSKYGVAPVPAGTILGQAFVDDAILSVPIPDYGVGVSDASGSGDNAGSIAVSVIVADPVDPATTTIITQAGRYFVKNTVSGYMTGPYDSAVTRGNTDSTVKLIVFDMLDGSIKAIRTVPASSMYANILDDGAVLLPNIDNLDAARLSVDTMTGNVTLKPLL
jgi:hypothetical protein